MGLMNDILGAAGQLAKDQYGNYVVQHVLEHGQPEERARVVRALAGQVVELSRHKFASNVVEKCIQFCAKDDRAALINEVLGPSEDGTDALLAMMTDCFSNYVVQRLMDFCDDEQKMRLIPRMRSHLGTVKKFSHGKHIASAVEKMSLTLPLELVPPPPEAAAPPALSAPAEGAPSFV
jgi:pumilio RNA-binding family